jgi:hypothetical protein
MDVNKAFRFVFDDTQWISKLLIGVLMSLLSFLILPALILQGYAVKIVRHVMAGNRDNLPEWSDYGDLLKDGFFVTVAEIIWTLPFIILFVVGGLATGGLGSLADNGSDLAAAGAMGGGLLLACLALLFVVALLFLMPAILIQYAITDEFGATFRFGEVWAIIRNNLADILLVFLVTIVAVIAIGLVAGIVGIVPCLGWLAAAAIGLAMGPYITYVTSHLYGQIGAKVLGNKASGYMPAA